MTTGQIAEPRGKLTKAEIIENIHNEMAKDGLHFSKKDVHKVLEAFFTEVKSGLIIGRVVELRGFGTFELRLRKGREKARNPRTGETLSVESHSVAVFRAGKELKDKVWPVKP
ncbi:MAG: integration host factor subunit beta [Spirochaetaceae bacterium]|nr:integration host factor subunit beta [Spirochaetaceae bacterium]